MAGDDMDDYMEDNGPHHHEETESGDDTATSSSPSPQSTSITTTNGATTNSSLSIFTSTSGVTTSLSITPSPVATNRDYTTTSTATSYKNSSVPTSVSGTTQLYTPSPHRAVTLTVILPLVLAIIVLLMLICSILIWEKTFKRKKPKRDSLKLQNNEMKQELGEVKGKIKDPYPIEQSAASFNLYVDPNSDGRRKQDTPDSGKEKLKDPYPIEQSVTSSNHYTDLKREGNKKVPATKGIASGEAQYAEVDEYAQPISTDSNPKKLNLPPSDHFKEGKQASHGYEEAIVGGTQRNDGYEEAKPESTRNGPGYEKAKDKGTQENDGYETAKVSGPFYYTLDPDAPSDSSYMSVSKNKQDGGYDTLDRKQNQGQTKSQTASGYDVTERIGKDGTKVEPNNKINSDYLAVSRSSANTSEYDILDHTRRSYQVGGISPNEYNALQPQEKE